MFVCNDPEGPGNRLSSRSLLLRDVLQYFGHYSPGLPTAVSVPALEFGCEIHPNPFNPLTTITYSLPRAGHLKLNIYNVRGQLIRTLVDEVRPAGENQTVVWDGTDHRGATVASGIYFYEARAAGEVKQGKMALLK